MKSIHFFTHRAYFLYSCGLAKKRYALDETKTEKCIKNPFI